MTLILPALSGLTFPVKRSPIQSTDVQRAVSGKTTALQRYTYPLWKYELPFDFLRSDSVNLELQTLAAFYNLAGGRANLWQFPDPDDGSVTSQSFGAGDGATTAFQLVRAMTGIGVSFVEPVFAPTGNPVIKVAGVTKATPADYTISGTTGLVTFVAAPANGAALTWTGTFNWWCRFDADSSDFEKFMSNLWDLKRLSFTSEKI